MFDANWPEEVCQLYPHDLQEMWDSTIAIHIWNQYHNQLDLYLELVDREKRLDILDVGCAQGTLALLLAEKGHRVVAVDLRQQFLDYAASRVETGDIRFVCGNVFDLEFDRNFDLIFANQILEHLVRPVEFTRRLAGWLKPGGRIVITTPNCDYAMNRLPSYSELGDPAAHESSQFTADADEHFFAYRPRSSKIF